MAKSRPPYTAKPLAAANDTMERKRLETRRSVSRSRASRPAHVHRLAWNR